MKEVTLRWNLVYHYGYTITNIINSLVLLPFYLEYIGKDVLGIWLATGNVLMWLTMVDPGIGDILQQKIASSNGNNNQEEINKTIASGLLAGILVLIACVVVGVGLSYLLPVIIAKNKSELMPVWWAYQISIFATGLTLFSFSLVGINQGLQKTKSVAISYITGNFIFFGINLILLISNFGVLSIAYANLLRAIWIVSFHLYSIMRGYLNNHFKLNFEKNHFIAFSKIFLYTSSARIVTSIANNIDLILVGRYLPPSFVSVFEVNRRPIKLLQGLITRYSVALMPIISFKSVNSEISKETRNLISFNLKHYVFITISLAGLFIISYNELITWWTKQDIFIGDKLFIYLVLTFLFSTIGSYLSNILYALGDIKANAKINLAKGLISTFALLFSIKYFGFEGFLICMSVISFLFDFLLFLLRSCYIKIVDWMTGKELVKYFSKSSVFILTLSSIILLVKPCITINSDLILISLICISYALPLIIFWTFSNYYSDKLKSKLSYYFTGLNK